MANFLINMTSHLMGRDLKMENNDYCIMNCDFSCSEWIKKSKKKNVFASKMEVNEVII
jgi:hypothetical protein